MTSLHRPVVAWPAGDSSLAVIPEGTVFRPEDLVFYASPQTRTLDDALAEADLLVSCPHAGSAMPAEVARHVVDTYTRRLQFDFTDMTTAPVVRRWAEIDPRIVYVENPHPRLVRDPNRPRPADLGATLREAFARVRTAGPLQRVDLSGVDAIRPVTFSFYPLLREPASEAEMAALIADFETAGAAGVDVYQATRADLLERLTGLALARGNRRLTTLSFHDTMNTTTTPEGAVNVPRAEADLLPPVVALSNRGDHRGETRLADDPATMDPARLRSLAAAHRTAFAGFSPDAGEGAVLLNQPYLGSEEITAARAQFAPHRTAAEAAGVTLDAVQGEFLRELLLGPAATEQLHRPGTDWPTLDPGHIDRLAHACKDAWDRYREQG